MRRQCASRDAAIALLIFSGYILESATPDDDPNQIIEPPKPTIDVIFMMRDRAAALEHRI
jgi:hypothetical protein